LDSQRALNRLHPVAFDNVALPHVLVVLEGHAAFHARTDFAHVVLETLELRELALVDYHVVADQPHIGAALDGAVGDAAAGALAGGARRHLLALLPRAVIGHFAGAGFVLDYGEAVTGVRCAGEAEHLDRRRRACAVGIFTSVGDQRANAAPFGAGDDEVADLE